MKLNIDWFNCDTATQSQLTTLIADACKAHGVNPFTVNSAFIENERCEVTFTEELSAYKFSTHCYFLRPFVKKERNLYRVTIRINRN